MVAEQVAPLRGGARRSVLRRRDYRLLLLSFTTSKLGDFLYLVALVAYVYGETGSAAWVSAAALSRFIPYTVLSPVAGVVADRYERRRVMAAGDAVQLVSMSAIAVTALVHGPSLVVIAAAAVSASAATLYASSASAMVRAVVPDDELAAANSLLSTVDELAFVAGPAAGGLLLLLGEPSLAFAINAGTFAASAALLLSIRTTSRREAAPGGQRGMAADLREGLSTLAGNSAVLVLVGCLVAGTVVYGAELVLLVLVSSELLGTGSEGLGWLLAASGVGGIVGAVASPRLARVQRPRLMIAALVLLTGLPFASLALIRAPLLACAVLVLEGLAIVALDILVETALQRSVPGDVLGRVSGLILSLSAVGTLVGTLAAPGLIEAVGLPGAVAIGGLVPVVVAAVSLARLRRLDTEAQRGAQELAPRVAVLEDLRLLEGATPTALERLAASIEEHRLGAGAVVLRQGEPADALYVLVAGSLVVEHDDGLGARRVNEMTAPDYLGEIGLVERVPRTATVVTASDAVLWRIPGEVFVEAVDAGTTLSPFLVSGITARRARTTTRAG